MRALAAGAMVVAASMATPVAAHGEDQLLGRWRTSAESGVVEIARCGQALCGRLVDAAPLRANPDQRDVRNRDSDLRSRPLRGIRVLNGFTGGPRIWEGGPLYDPESGRQADRGSLTLVDPDTLEVRGCVARVLCRTQTWRRLR